MTTPADPPPALALTGVRKGYATPQGRLEVLRGVSLKIPAGGSLALTGESGSGKSTLLHLAGGLDTPDGGEIRVAGRTASGLDDGGRAALRRDRVGLVFQQFNLVPSLSVADNLAFQARLARREDPDWTAMLAERLGIADLLSRWPEQLSGGQQQRVAIGRALAARPALILADEPTGALDETAADAALDLLLELTAEAGGALMMVTHSPRLAARLSHRLHLQAGRLVAPPEAP
ncbi:ABC transporter ATP-binding protein [Albimonas sp. CAU 1670]|uniref:ABC transporter ATP-binding protein n=1 Tax=Albimonas sp. CAU 1670 TaxID=3032599 RepID=UPI0023DA8530|nr:ABC transporter ATP-binding protein [Albimonas sp. CAU 1670]MDF2234881.1 ABC transporter ATP-binding protein [Albimonas sp. CAU 1670]